MKKRNYAALLLSCLMLLAPVSGGINAAAEEEPAPFDPDSVPGVIPAIREWNGDTSDYFTLDAGTVLLNTAKSASVKKVAGFFKDMCGIEPLCVYEDNGGKVIEFVISDTLPDRVTDEGYTLGITKDRVTVTAKTDVGLLYGGITLVQMNYYEGVIRCGSAVDYPEYPLRSGMLDVGRMWIPLDYVEEITKYMAWFKLNEIHLHINDHDGDGNTGFRLESDIPGLSTVKNGEKQYYTKDEYRAYQKRMLEYGVTVVTEIDTPAHSGAFSKVTEGGPSMIGGKSLDIRDEHREETLEFVKKVFDEYLLGDDPVFVGKVVHIGTDEYDRAYSEEMRKYTAALAEYIYSLGYTPRFWAGFGKSGFQGETEIPGFLQANFWDNDISGLDETVAGGYDIINTLNSLLYTVPTGNGFPDYLDLEYLYKNWQVYLFNGWGYNKKVEKGYEHLLGACFALWNDLGFKNFGITKYDVFDRLRGMVAIVSEKAWTGDQTSQIPVSDFMT
ncbi:MAG: family 20 glycosylhydrolase, partial [Clostridia bacterium]|nr:family 20 glycosylhydrolase [Clostridia bacterium]